MTSTSLRGPTTGERIAHLRRPVASGESRPLAWRIRNLEALASFLTEREQELTDAVEQDLGRQPFSTWLADISVAKAEIDHCLKNVKRWMKPRKAKVPLALQPGRAESIAEPKGVALILAPWNYPIQLSVAPIAAALAAGNTVVFKPSELAPATAGVLAEGLESYLGPDTVHTAVGGPEVASELLEHRFDHIFFTGSPRIGKVVMAAAAKHLTPVTLELGGKSPTIVTASADLDMAAKRIAWAKTLNAGQTCVAPDYVLVQESVRQPLVDKLSEQLPKMFHADGQPTRIVSDGHADRLRNLMQNHGGETILDGGGSGRDFSPVLIDQPRFDSPLMTDEIFGPILPVISFSVLQDALDYINRDEKPLALYLFTNDRADEEATISGTSSGGVVVNHLLQHLLIPDLPFGGVGQSGMGAYHGETGFEAFSHRKSILRKPAKAEPPFVYPPYPKLAQRLLRRIL